jgi:HSP20 family molecular chaperone IbpA
MNVIENEINQINNNFKIHEFDSKKYERHIILPNNIDVAFANACYTDGILKLHFSKTNSPDTKQQCKLFVY